jgi:RNA 2',3'-cyclic 3'-phosphodiesterase
MRLFIGIPIADAVADELKAFVARLRTNADGLRWSAPESWHITLQFLGNTAPEQIECLTARLGELRWVPVAMEMGEPGFFDRAGVFVADVVVSPRLAGLQQRVLAATSQCGFVAETRPFHPHITLAREARNKEAREQGNKTVWSQVGGLSALKTKIGKPPRFSPFTAHEFLLYESHLDPEGSRYEVRERFQFGER